MRSELGPVIDLFKRFFCLDQRLNAEENVEKCTTGVQRPRSFFTQLEIKLLLRFASPILAFGIYFVATRLYLNVGVRPFCSVGLESP